MMVERVQKINMNYYVYINGTTHKLIQGFTINEEYNETLDSASIIISDSPQLDIDPYDDVFIYSEYCGYYDKNKEKIVPNYDKVFEFKGYPIDNYSNLDKPFFYKHFLIYKFVEKIIILGEKEEDTRYEYTIELFSETKGLETIQAPNTCITQPLENKISTVTYVNRFLGLYNKKIKKTQYDVENWETHLKYWLGNTDDNQYFSIEEIKPVNIHDNVFEFNSTNLIIGILNLQGETQNLLFANIERAENFPLKNYDYYKVNDQEANFSIIGNYEKIVLINENYVVPTLLTNVVDVFKQSYTPDFTLNNPSLRQILEKLFITKDCIPVVHDDRIYAMDITLRRGKFNLKKGQINYITGSKDSSNFCTDLKRTYNEALTQENSSRFTEFLGFRNSDSAFLTFNNLRLETRFPIYKINKIYMCYFKKIRYYDESGNVSDKIFLCKQNITPLVKLNSERNILSEDIEDFNMTPKSSIEEMAKYKLATVGYDIGSNYIEGWGTQYSYPTKNFFWQTEVKSYIENLFNYMDTQFPLGIYKFDYLIKKIIGEGAIPTNYTLNYYNSISDTIVIPENNLYDNVIITSDIEKLLNSTLGKENLALRLKHLFFEIDYQGFYNGTVIHSKGLGKDNLTINDNQSASLALLELDGLAQREKLDRYGNKGIQISARYKDINDIQLLGSVYDHNKDQDVVIYHKQYSINDNVIDCSYSGTKDYVLKDYFTSVYARHRTYNLMSYGESVTRAENQKIYFLISKDKKIEDEELEIYFEHFDSNFIKSFFSFFNSSQVEAYGRIDESEKINYGFFRKKGQIYATDINVFVSGTSLCLNICMYDNITSGTYISKIKNAYLSYDTSNYTIGATQKWINLVDNMTTGEIKDMDFCFGHIQIGNGYGYIDEDKVYDESKFDVEEKYEKIFNLPKIIGSPFIKNQIWFNKVIYKDNKEKIDMTLQIEPIVDTGILVSPWLSKLSDLFSVYEKFNEEKEYTAEKKEKKSTNFVYVTTFAGSGSAPIICIIVNTENENWLDNFPPQFENALVYEGGTIILSNSKSGSGYNNFSITTKNLISVTESEIILNCDMAYELNQGTAQGTYKNITLNLPEVSSTGLGTQFFSQVKLDSNKYKMYAITLGDQDNTNFYKGISWNCWAGDGSSYVQKNSFVSQQNLIVYSIEKVLDYKGKNLYWVYTPSNYELRSYMVSDELDNLNNFNELIVDSLDTTKRIGFLWDTNNGILKILHPELDYGSHILCYYKTSKYNFVFGFKPDESILFQGKTSKVTRLNFSLLSFKDLTVFDEKTNLPIGKVPSSVI